jgi:hypothetical protein
MLAGSDLTSQLRNRHKAGWDILAVFKYIDHCSYPPCRARRPRPAECRPKFISVTARGARVRRSVDRNLFRSPRGAPASGGV